jgi:Methyltransferase FkbM domain
VEVRTLDEVLGDRLANGLKVDVEGAERLVLNGGAVAIAERRLPVIQLEWNRTSKSNFGEKREILADLLVETGYEFFRPSDHGDLAPTEVGTFGSDVFAVLNPQIS